MLAYTAGDGLQAIRRTFGVDASATEQYQYESAPSRQRRNSSTAWRAFVQRAGRLFASFSF